MSVSAPGRADLTAARDDLATFAALVGSPLQAWQADACRLATRTTAIVAPRQMGKSLTLSVLALHRAFRTPGQRVLIVSAGEEAARRLLGQVRSVLLSPLLAGSVLDESLSLVTLSNGSEIRSVPASERAIRGWSVDLLLVDEAALVSDDVILGAAFPTTAARPDARIVLASSPWGPSGAFHRAAMAGSDPSDPHVRAFRWRVEDAPWVTSAVIDHARAMLPAPRFRAEYLGEFVGASDLYFDREAVLGAVAAYRLLAPERADGEAVAVGLDWGRAVDSHAIACVGVLDDHGLNEQPVLFLPWLETSRRPYAAQVDAVVALSRPLPRAAGWYRGSAGVVDTLPDGRRVHFGGGASLPGPGAPTTGGYRIARLLSETNGVGAAPTEEVAARLPSVSVGEHHTSQPSKETDYGRLRALLGSGRLVLPEHELLLRQLRAITYAITPSGGLTIGGSGPGADDLTDALTLALAAVGSERLSPGSPSSARGVPDVVHTPSGIAVPLDARPRRSALARRSRGYVVH